MPHFNLHDWEPSLDFPLTATALAELAPVIAGPAGVFAESISRCAGLPFTLLNVYAEGRQYERADRIAHEVARGYFLSRVDGEPVG